VSIGRGALIRCGSRFIEIGDNTNITGPSILLSLDLSEERGISHNAMSVLGACAIIK
jgi:hypothetical protein